MEGNNVSRNRRESGRDKNSSDVSFAVPPPSGWLDRYNKYLDRYPLRTKMITSFCVSAFGSALGSYLSASANEDRAKIRSKRNNGQLCKTSSEETMLAKINWVDVLSYAIEGGLISAPICHYWFEWLSVNGPSSNTASVLVDQLVVQPPLCAFMFICLDVLRASIRATIYQFREARVVSKSVMNALKVVPTSWRFWPFAVYFTFKYLKKKHYTVALNLCSVAWTVYLSRGAGDGGGGSEH
ncbi:hypothetical protein ACHAXR_007489 [Thalassiosira sp. AJA248-18]